MQREEGVSNDIRRSPRSLRMKFEFAPGNWTEIELILILKSFGKEEGDRKVGLGVGLGWV